jgi:DNA invertase Pin-like site-specific DNA recombinase
MSSKMVRCAIYTRKSTEEGLEQDFNSLDAQREACFAYITSHKPEGWIGVRDRFDDGGYSGGTLERPALKRLLESIENGSVDVVVVYKIDRLSRSLMDFAKLVEVFDRKSVTFVSVTQSFNTTTSMGRLTLNVLLSFAQFEREVTGERIRDKVAASKKRGIWMGGNPPLGYDVRDRKLIVNAIEAETVQLIFKRYLNLGCVRLLADDLAKRGIVSKRRIIAGGKEIGGRPIGRSALFLLLNNRTYLGETIHKDASYKGEHEAIVPSELFEAVQRKLAENHQPVSVRTRVWQKTLLSGLVFDDAGTAMLPTYTLKQGSLRYCYYVSRPRLKGDASDASITRISAPKFEGFVLDVLDRLQLKAIEVRSIVRRIDVMPHSVRILLDKTEAVALWRVKSPDRHDKEILCDARRYLLAGETLSPSSDHLILTLPVRAKFPGGRAHQSRNADRAPPSPDLPLIKAVARAHRWHEMLLSGEVETIGAIARRFGMERGHAGRILNLAFLNPRITRAILQGEQPQGLRLSHLLQADIPLSWEHQDGLLARLAESARQPLLQPYPSGA